MLLFVEKKQAGGGYGNRYLRRCSCSDDLRQLEMNSLTVLFASPTKITAESANVTTSWIFETTGEKESAFGAVVFVIHLVCMWFSFPRFTMGLARAMLSLATWL